MTQDIQLRELWEKAKRQRRLTEELAELQRKQALLDVRVKGLEEKSQKAKKNAERLEKAGVRSFFYALTGKKEEMLEKERTEAAAAMTLYEETFLKLKSVNNEIERKEAEWKTLEGYEEKFLNLLEEKRRWISESERLEEAEIMKAERKLKELKNLVNRIIEFEKQGEDVFKQIEQLKITLMQAERAEMMRKYAGTGQLDKAQKQTAALQKSLREFEMGVRDVLKGEMITDNLDVVYQFCNGIYTSYIASNSVMQTALIERIRTAKGNAGLLEKQILEVKERLLERQREVECEERRLQEMWEEMLINV